MMKLSEAYKEKAFELANVIGKLEDLYDSLKYLDTKEGGNYFPSISLAEAFKPLASALASTVVYWHEYAEGECKKDDKDVYHLSEDPEDSDD